MTALAVQIGGKDRCVAGREDVRFLMATLVGANTGAPNLHVGSVISHRPTECEYLTWISENIEVGEELAITITGSTEYSDVLRRNVSDPTQTMRRLRELERKSEGKPTPPLPVLYPNLAFEITVNGKPEVTAFLESLNQIQLELTWHDAKGIHLSAISISSIGDGRTKSKGWIQRELKLSDIASVRITDVPDNEASKMIQSAAT